MTIALTHTHISLFTGAGGLDIGLERAGFATLACAEKDRHALETLRLNHERAGRCVAYFEDVTAITGEDILTEVGLAVGELDLLSGGPPCQPFSTAGARQSIVDPRGSLFGRYLELVGEMRPRFFLLENVRGLISAALRHRPLARRGPDSPELEPDERLGSLLNEALLPAIQERLGYQVSYGLANAADYGTPQLRERVIFIASRDRELGDGPGFGDPLTSLMPPTHGGVHSYGLPPRRTLRDALDGLNERPPVFVSYSPERRRVFDLVPSGANWRHIRDHHGPEMLQRVMGGAYESDGGRVGFWRRLSWDRPSPTLPASPVQKSTGLCHPDETRPLSVREYARIQQFPDDYEFAGPIASKYRQIGNAVPVGLAEAAGQAVIRLLDKVEPIAVSARPAQRRLLERTSAGK